MSERESARLTARAHTHTCVVSRAPAPPSDEAATDAPAPAETAAEEAPPPAATPDAGAEPATLNTPLLPPMTRRLSTPTRPDR